jgi:poly(3-hydroxybutyrate) depolymerase
MFFFLSLLSAVPSIQDTIFPDEYLVAGPFLSGVRESDWRNLPEIADDEIYVPREGDSLFSVMATGGWVRWDKTAVDSSSGWLITSYPNVEWDTLQNFYGISGLFNSGYAYVEVEVPERSRALAIAKRCGFSINKRSYSGDIYGRGKVQVPVVLDSGINRIWVRLGGAGDDRVFFQLVPTDDDVRLITKDATLPDLVYCPGLGNPEEIEQRGITVHESFYIDSLGPFLGAVPVSNTTEDWTRNTQLIVGGGDFILDTFDLPPIAPMSFYKAPFEFTLIEQLPDSVPGDTMMLPLSVISDEGRTEATLKLRCRRPDESRSETFLSRIDSSVQYYGIRYPENYDPDREYALIFSLHGASVEASGQANCYAQKDWAFVVAPTNRRPFGFDWQDWGRLDALEVLTVIKERYPIDADRVQLTGHSMGGHGVWHVGLTHPDLFASASPEAGWTNHQLYVPWTWQKSALYAEPWQLAVRDHVLRTDNQLARLENACNLPIYILHGSDDDNVPTFQGRLYVKRLDRLGFDYTYEEVPGKKHWWSDDGVSCVDWANLIGFMQDKVRDPYPEHVYYRSADLSVENGAYWLSVHTIENRVQDAVIEGWYEDGNYRISTTNLNRFALSVPEEKTGTAFDVEIDDVVLSVRPDADSMVFEQGKKSWQIAKKSNYLLPHPPIKGAYYSPFVLVYGTLGDSTATAKLFSMARGEAQAWWVRANGTVRIVPDTAVTDEIIEHYNLILYGNAEQNVITARIEASLPIRIEDGRFVFGSERLPPEAVASVFVYPNPLNPEKRVLVREGIGEDGLKLSGYFSTMYSGAGIPDYVIWSDEVSDKGWGGVVKNGFFNVEWNP